MGTPEDTNTFINLLKRTQDVELLEISDLYSNKGTKKYFRRYLEIRFKKK